MQSARCTSGSVNIRRHSPSRAARGEEGGIDDTGGIAGRAIAFHGTVGFCATNDEHGLPSLREGERSDAAANTGEHFLGVRERRESAQAGRSSKLARTRRQHPVSLTLDLVEQEMTGASNQHDRAGCRRPVGCRTGEPPLHGRATRWSEQDHAPMRCPKASRRSPEKGGVCPKSQPHGRTSASSDCSDRGACPGLGGSMIVPTGPGVFPGCGSVQAHSDPFRGGKRGEHTDYSSKVAAIN